MTCLTLPVQRCVIVKARYSSVSGSLSVITIYQKPASRSHKTGGAFDCNRLWRPSVRGQAGNHPQTSPGGILSVMHAQWGILDPTSITVKTNNQSGRMTPDDKKTASKRGSDLSSPEKSSSPLNKNAFDFALSPMVTPGESLQTQRRRLCVSWTATHFATQNSQIIGSMPCCSVACQRDTEWKLHQARLPFFPTGGRHQEQSGLAGDDVSTTAYTDS